MSSHKKKNSQETGRETAAQFRVRPVSKASATLDGILGSPNPAEIDASAREQVAGLGGKVVHELTNLKAQNLAHEVEEGREAPSAGKNLAEWLAGSSPEFAAEFGEKLEERAGVAISELPAWLVTERLAEIMEAQAKFDALEAEARLGVAKALLGNSEEAPLAA